MKLSPAQTLPVLAGVSYMRCSANAEVPVDSTLVIQENIVAQRTPTSTLDGERMYGDVVKGVLNDNGALVESRVDEHRNGTCTHEEESNDKEEAKDAEEDEINDDLTYIYDVPEEIQDRHDLCQLWADEGECNANPNFMLRECIRSCLSIPAVQEHGLLGWGEVVHFDEDCVDSHTLAVQNGEVEEDDDDEGCEDWARDNLCGAIHDRHFMLDNCKMSCMVCIPNTLTTFDIGMPQRIPSELLHETLDVLMETSNYMSHAIMDTRNTKYHTTRKSCKNEDALCAVWAAEGECDPDSNHFNYMALNCAPVCRTCDLLDYKVRCPIPEGAEEALSRNGGDNGLHAMFERIVGERNLTEAQLEKGIDKLEYSVNILSRPSPPASSVDVIDGPWVITLDNFVSVEECDELIALGKAQGYERSSETKHRRDGSLETDLISSSRTSTNTWCEHDCKSNKLVKQVQERIATITGFPVDNSENLQLLNYQEGQYYKAHHDMIEANVDAPAGPRVITVFLYLNEGMEGGGTRFPELAPDAPPVTVQAKRGRALIWPSTLDGDINTADDRTIHEALPVLKGEKFGANAWLHLRDEQNVEGFDC